MSKKAGNGLKKKNKTKTTRHCDLIQSPNSKCSQVECVQGVVYPSHDPRGFGDPPLSSKRSRAYGWHKGTGGEGWTSPPSATFWSRPTISPVFQLRRKVHHLPPPPLLFQLLDFPGSAMPGVPVRTPQEIPRSVIQSFPLETQSTRSWATTAPRRSLVRGLLIIIPLFSLAGGRLSPH
jgi:hypothetical protein